MDNRVKEDIKPEAQNNNQPKLDTGLACLVMIAKFHGVASDPEQIKHAFAIGNDGMNETDILRAAKELGFKAKAVDVEFERLQKLPMPMIVKIQAIGDSQYVILAKIEGEQVLILHPAENKPRILKKMNLCLNGQAIPLTLSLSHKGRGRRRGVKNKKAR